MYPLKSMLIKIIEEHLQSIGTFREDLSIHSFVYPVNISIYATFCVKDSVLGGLGKIIINQL